MPSTDVRTYETFAIVWPRGSTWTGFDFDGAVSRVAAAGEGRVTRSTWTVDFTDRPELAAIALPGISDAEHQRWAAYEAGA